MSSSVGEDHLLLGANPFVGTSHFDNDRARGYSERLTRAHKLKIMSAAFGAGATGFTFSPNPTIHELLRDCRDSRWEFKVGLYPLLPSLSAYWPALVDGGPWGLVTEVLKDLSLAGKTRALIGGGVSILTRSPWRAIETYITTEIDRLRKSSPRGWEVRGVFLSENFTDMAVALNAKDAVGRFVSMMTQDLSIRPGLQTLNLPFLVRRLKEWKLHGSCSIMAPFNPLGHQMTPKREDSEALLWSDPQLDLVAISLLAGGMVPLDGAINYLQSLPMIRKVAVGVSSEPQARETFSKLGFVATRTSGRSPG